MIVSAIAVTALMLQQGSVSGAVYDSTAARPLSGATVSIVGAADSLVGRTKTAVTDSAGRYAVTGLTPGSYVIGFTHPVLDSLQLSQELVPLEIDAGELVLDLATTSRSGVAASRCGPSSIQGRSVVYGRALDASRRPLSNVSVRARVESSARRPGEDNAESRVTTDEDGAFRFCDLTAGTVVVEASRDAARTGRLPLVLPPDDFTHVVLVLDEGSSSTARPTYRLSGIVTDASGSPVPGASASLVGVNRRAGSDNEGRFALADLPGGTHSLMVRKPGFTPANMLVHVTRSDSIPVLVTLAPLPVVLDAVVVSTNAATSEFLNRRRRSAVAGHFLDGERIGLYHETAGLTTLVADVPGVRKVCGMGGCFLQMQRMASTMTATGREACRPHLFVDGVRDRIVETDFEMLRAADIAAIEVYSREAQLPAEFIALADRSPCGAIAVWTKGRRVP